MQKMTILYKQTQFPYIIRDKRICNGAPTIKNTRIRIIDIAHEFEILGMTPDQIIDNHPHLTLAQVHSALSYYYENKVELDNRYNKNLKFIVQIKKTYPSKMEQVLARH